MESVFAQRKRRNLDVSGLIKDVFMIGLVTVQGFTVAFKDISLIRD